MKKIVSLFILCICLYSCNNRGSKNELESRVKADINSEFSKKATENNINYNINSFELIHKGGDEYYGILKTTEGGDEFTYEVNVRSDGNNYKWEIVNNIANESTDEVAKITCEVCGEQIIGDGYNPELLGVGGQSYLCSQKCAKIADEIATEKYNKILRENGYDEIKSESNDGKIYDNNACTLCKGTGIEKNTSHLTNEYGRTCPMCDGKGVKSY